MKDTINIQELQELVNTTQKIREKSWKHEVGRPRFEYTLTMRQAAQKACENCPTFFFTVYLLCECAWNDAQELNQSF